MTVNPYTSSIIIPTKHQNAPSHLSYYPFLFHLKFIP